MPAPVDAIQIRVATEADIPQVIELMRVALGEGKIPRTREFFEWKHQQNPFGRSPMWVAEAGGQLVGLRIFMRWSWGWGDERFASAVRAVDTATHPDFQGRGIFRKLTLALVEQVTREGVELIFNTPNAKSRPGYLKMGWVSAGKASLWLRPELSPASLLRLTKLVTTRAHAETEQPSESDGAALFPALAEAEGAGLLRPALRRGSAHYQTPKDGAYLRWRYAACPAAKYWSASDDPRSALVIYRVRERHGLRELSISELFFARSLSGARAATRALGLARTAARADYALIAFEHDALQGLALSAAGFIPALSGGPIVTTRPLNPAFGAPDPLRVRSFRAAIGDLELF
jgi:GNAT superfamily N-acetyltransferase